MQVLLSSIGTRGDVQPILALGLELQSLGHRARFVRPSQLQRLGRVVWVGMCPDRTASQADDWRHRAK